MGVDLLAKYVGESAKSSLDPANSGPCFRLVNKPPRYLVFHNGDGKETAVAYSLLQSLVHDPSIGLVLRFGSVTVTIEGRNLKPAFQPLMEHLVQECCKGDERQGEAARLRFVTAIKFDFK